VNLQGPASETEVTSAPVPETKHSSKPKRSSGTMRRWKHQFRSGPAQSNRQQRAFGLGSKSQKSEFYPSKDR
jgi:hypothetical protein